jgi:hypothetical protein
MYVVLVIEVFEYQVLIQRSHQSLKTIKMFEDTDSESDPSVIQSSV